MKKMQSGITLIALIITVIVLLILAGAAISIGINGGKISSKTETSAEISNTKNLKESTSIAFLTAKAYGEGETFKEKLENQMQGVIITEVEGQQGVYYVEKDKVAVTVYENGDILEGKTGFWDGSTIECPKFKKENNIWNWYIYTAGQLKFFADFVNNGNSLIGTESGADLTNYVTNAGYSIENITMGETTTIYLMNDIDLGAKEGAGETLQEKWENPSNESKKWTPIGVTSNEVIQNLGIFEGNNHFIKGIYVNREKNNNGVFAKANIIRNLIVKDGYICGNSYTGGIVGFLNKTIENCHNINTTVNVKENESQYFNGGIVGFSNQNSSISKCTNSGTIVSTGKCKYTGGIVGETQTLCTISNCTNNGNILGNESKIGGIVGYASLSCQIINCINNGNVSHKSSNINYQQDVGGIAGRAMTNTKILNCINNGQVYSEAYYTGGLVGQVVDCIIDKCANNGQVLLNWNGRAGVGGLIGVFYAENEWILTNCYNTAEVKGKADVGGIIGNTVETKGNIKSCYSIGITSGTSNVGGLIGNNSNGSASENSYYLTGTATLDCGNVNTSNLAKDENYLTSDFVTIANQNETIWEVIEGKNNGFPVLRIGK